MLAAITSLGWSGPTFSLREPAWLSVGQRHGGKLHAHVEARGGERSGVSRSGRAEPSIGVFIENTSHTPSQVYNRQRLHSALRYLAPEAFETHQAASSGTVS